MRKRKKKEQKSTQPEQSMLGRIIDLPLEEFKQELINQKVNVGVMNNLKLNLISAYEELVTRKDYIIKRVQNNHIDRDYGTKTIEGIYAEMTKIEQKVLYLNERVKELLNLDGDTPKD